MPRKLADVAMDLIVSRLPNPYTRSFDGLRITFNLRDRYLSRSLLFRGKWEPYETSLVEKLVSPGDTVADIGANIGYYSLILASKVKEVHSFEPDPANFSYLRFNIQQNRVGNVILVNKAVSDQSRCAMLYLSEDNYGDHNLWAKGDRKAVEVETTSLDDYFQIMPKRLDFAKMDIQGGEWNAFKGMKQIVEQSRSLKVITEFWPEGLKGMGSSPIALLKLLADYGFDLFRLDEEKKRLNRLPESGFEDLAQMKSSTNLLCLRNKGVGIALPKP